MAYSLRNLSAASASNPVVRVRRSSGSPSEADFKAGEVSDGTLETWVGAGNNGFVVTWYDQSGNNNHASQSTTALQPKIVSSGTLETESGKPAVLWTATDIHLAFTTRLTTIRSYFLLAKVTNTSLGNDAPFLLGDSTSFDFHGGATTWLNLVNSAAEVRNGVTRLNGVATNFVTTNRSTTRYIFTMIPTGNTEGSSLFRDRSSANKSWVGPVQEVIIYTSDQTASMPFVEANINTYYGVY